MRKALFICVTSLCFMVYAGYRGTYWNESIIDAVKDGKKQCYTNNNKYAFLYESARMLGQSTNIYYTFYNSKLCGISYMIDDTKEANALLDTQFESKNLRKAKHLKYDLNGELQSSVVKEWETIKKDYPCFSVLVVDDILGFNAGLSTMIGDLYELEEKNGQGDIDFELIEAYFSYDTKVHIYKGLYPGKLIVIYTELPQDF